MAIIKLKHQQPIFLIHSELIIYMGSIAPHMTHMDVENADNSGAIICPCTLRA